MAMSVAPSNGSAVCRPMAVSASCRDRFFCRPTSIPSTITTALSKSIPIAKMNEPRDTRCNVPPVWSRINTEPSTVTNIVAPRIIPERKFMVIMMSRMTRSTDSMRLSMNVFIAFFTRSLWKNTFSYSILAGRRDAFISAIFSSTSAPTLMISAPGWGDMSRPRAWLPSYSISARNGCSGSIVTSAISPNRNSSPL